ncbi:MAG TPA: pre-peptidase C-terminal domain-containing protein [Thermoanaerobaculia bacterium]
MTAAVLRPASPWKLLSLLMFLSLLLGIAAPSRAIVPPGERKAILALYSGAGGARWVNREGWGRPAGSECDWYGVRCNEARTTVEEIFLADNGLTGKLPAKFGNLPNLRTLDLESNALTGAIPKDLARLRSLRDLRLGLNQLSGPIPKDLGNLANLQTLSLSFNKLSGAIPADLGRLAVLQVLDLSRNQLTGALPLQLGNLRSLQYLDLSANRLTGVIPADLGRLTGLVSLYLGGNQITGGIPKALGTLAVLEQLGLSDNQLTGRIPPELGNLSRLAYLDLERNQLSGLIPAKLGSATSLQGLLLTGNRLSGNIPGALGNLQSLAILWLGANRLTGPVPLELGNLPELLENAGLDLRGNSLATDTEAGLLLFLNEKQVGGNWIASQAPAALFEIGTPLGSLADRRTGGWVYWRVDVGTGAPALKISTEGGTGEVDLYVRFGARPMVELNDAASAKAGNLEMVTIAAPKPGTYYIGLHSRAPYAGVTLKAGG